MRYLAGTIFSSGSGMKAYEENYDRIFARAEPEQLRAKGAVALNGHCGKCLEVGPVFPNPAGPIALCANCSEAA